MSNCRSNLLVVHLLKEKTKNGNFIALLKNLNQAPDKMTYHEDKLRKQIFAYILYWSIRIHCLLETRYSTSFFSSIDKKVKLSTCTPLYSGQDGVEKNRH